MAGTNARDVTAALPRAGTTCHLKPSDQNGTISGLCFEDLNPGSRTLAHIPSQHTLTGSLFPQSVLALLVLDFGQQRLAWTAENSLADLDK